MRGIADGFRCVLHRPGRRRAVAFNESQFGTVGGNLR